MKPAPRLPQWPPPSRWYRDVLSWHHLTRIALTVATAGALTVLIFFHLDYYQVGSSLEQFRVGRPVPVDVLAPRAMTWTLDSETEQLRDEAAAAVPTVYDTDPSALPAARADLESIFADLSAASLSAAACADLERMHLSADTIAAGRALDPATRVSLRDAVLGLLNTVMAAPIRAGTDEEGDAAAQVTRLASAQVSDAGNARLAAELARAVLRPTMTEDARKTEASRRAARQAVQPVIHVLNAGDIALHRGETVTADDLRQLTQNRLVSPAPERLVPIAFLMLFAVICLGTYLRVYYRPVYDSDRRLLLLACLVIAPAFAALMLGQGNEYLVPLVCVPAAAMAIAGLLCGPIAIVATVILSISVALPADQAFFVLLLALGSGLAGIMAVDNIWPASRAIPAVASLIAINFVLLVCVTGISPGGMFSLQWTDVGYLALTAAGGALGAVVVSVGTIYLLAHPFRITTHYRLMELANPNEPLLRRMMLEAPGSYHSSVMVANMAEAAADALGLDVLLTRVAALYHDIGKLTRPTFFVENQAPLGTENVHDNLAPSLSYHVLAGHVRDGVEIARANHLPEEMVQIIAEHHGTTLAAYFYHRAVTAAAGGPASPRATAAGDGGPPAESDFRYPGPKPSTREAAVVMLADGVQASVKSIKEPSPRRIEAMVNDIINGRLQDGQFEACDITLRDLHEVSVVFTRMLTGLYSYTRVEYPEVKGESGRIYAGIDTQSASAASEADTAAPGD